MALICLMFWKIYASQVDVNYWKPSKNDEKETKEAKKVKDICGEEFLTVVPGIRPRIADSQDQKRIMTPEEAVKNGADILIIGRPLTRSKDPKSAAKEIRISIENNDN